MPLTKKELDGIKFGIVAAMADKSRIIGVEGRIPWNAPQDRALFKNLTRGKVLVIGRKTFWEEPNQCHISHAAHTIVVSRTLQNEDIDLSRQNSIHVARSFPDALLLARQLLPPSVLDSSSNDDSTVDKSISCWVAGGEKLYNVALVHPSVSILHLTIVDKVIDTTPDQEVARFPVNYRWDRLFELVQTEDLEPANDNPKCKHLIYKRVFRF